MVAERKPRTGLADPSAALVSYLDDLLHTATATGTVEEMSPATAETVAPAEPDSPVQARVDEALAPDLPDEASEADVSVPPAAGVVRETMSPEPEQGQISDRATEPPLPAEPEGRPHWADKPFECLIFKVAGLQLAVPLVLLGAIHRIDDKIRPIPGRPPWYLGMLPDRGLNLKVVDSAQWIMAGRVPPDAREGYRLVIRLDDSDWALACDEVAESFTLDPDEVRWRTARSQRPWLAGTVVRHMCALIDVGAMARLLARAEREHRLDLD